MISKIRFQTADYDVNPLLITIINLQSNLNFPLQIVETLLSNGAHIDSRNGHGHRPLDMLKNIPDCKINPLMYLTLRCLAAGVIAQNKLPYKREIPAMLEEFIEAH